LASKDLSEEYSIAETMAHKIINIEPKIIKGSNQVI
jgi:hypothetical protein